MIINEKGLLKIMKEAHKGPGYNVAAEIDAGNVENIIITTPKLAVVIEKKNLPRKVLGLIAEHVGDIPEPGEAFQVKKKEPQTEIFDIATRILRDIHADNKPMKLIKRTDITLGGYQLWQRKDDLRIFKVDPALEDILLLSRGTVRIVGDDMLMQEDLESRAYIAVEKPDAKAVAGIDHLSKMQWVAM